MNQVREMLKISLNPTNYVDLGISLLLAILTSIFIYKLSKRFGFVLLFMFLYILDAITDLYNLMIASEILNIILLALLTSFIIGYSSRLVTTFNKLAKKKHLAALDNIDREEFYNIIEDTVINLSATKTGAIMTFEKGEDLTDYIEKGKAVDCKVSSDLIRSIFYVGTPLHDGAIIISGNIIRAASIFYTPATRAMPGKFGARHRAALGFSETHSSLTVVVSEETGRISFAYKGELINCTHENFKQRFKELINQ